MVLIGVPVACMVAGAMTTFQQATGDRHRGRVYGATVAVDGAAMLLGTVAAGALAERIGILPVITTQGAVYAAAGIMLLLTLPRETTTVRPDVSLAA
jgi:hypothetical protein